MVHVLRTWFKATSSMELSTTAAEPDRFKDNDQIDGGKTRKLELKWIIPAWSQLRSSR